MKTTIFFLLMGSFVLSAIADDSIVADYGKTVYPKQTDDIQMLSEKVDVTFGENAEGCREADVTCHFVFRNATKSTVTATVGFPGNDSETGPGWSRPLSDFKASIGGKSIQTKVKPEILWGDPKKDEHYGYKDWYIWEMTFPPKSDTVVDNSYAYCLSSNSGYGKLSLKYELDTGANWRGKIGDAAVTVTYDDSDDLENRVIAIQPTGWVRKDNQILWHFKDLEPSTTDNILIQEKNPESNMPNRSAPLLFKPPPPDTGDEPG